MSTELKVGLVVIAVSGLLVLAWYCAMTYFEYKQEMESIKEFGKWHRGKQKVSKKFTIRPYRLQCGTWVFDDPDVGLFHEALVDGMPEIIETATPQLNIPCPEEGFNATFSDEPFEGHQLFLEWVREEGGGNVYKWNNMEGWLCPALFRYFDNAPQRLYLKVGK